MCIKKTPLLIECKQFSQYIQDNCLVDNRLHYITNIYFSAGIIVNRSRNVLFVSDWE